MVLMLSFSYRETEQEDDSSQAIQNTAKGLYCWNNLHELESFYMSNDNLDRFEILLLDIC